MSSLLVGSLAFLVMGTCFYISLLCILSLVVIKLFISGYEMNSLLLARHIITSDEIYHGLVPAHMDKLQVSDRLSVTTVMTMDKHRTVLFY